MRMPHNGSQDRDSTPRGASPLKFERRGGPRWQTGGAGMATFISMGGGPKLVRVTVLDACQRGLGVKSEEPVEIGATFSLFPDDALASVSRGRVVRCVRDGDGYRLGLQRLIRHAA
jgi:hypothetical protein